MCIVLWSNCIYDRWFSQRHFLLWFLLFWLNLFHRLTQYNQPKWVAAYRKPRPNYGTRRFFLAKSNFNLRSVFELQVTFHPTQTTVTIPKSFNSSPILTPLVDQIYHCSIFFAVLFSSKSFHFLHSRHQSQVYSPPTSWKLPSTPSLGLTTTTDWPKLPISLTWPFPRQLSKQRSGPLSIRICFHPRVWHCVTVRLTNTVNHPSTPWPLIALALGLGSPHWSEVDGRRAWPVANPVSYRINSDYLFG